jgi:hypothetical protein
VVFPMRNSRTYHELAPRLGGKYQLCRLLDAPRLDVYWFSVKWNFRLAALASD